MCLHPGTASHVSAAVGLVPGTQPVGAFRGSGYREPPLLVQRADGQLVRLPELLYLVVRLLSEHAGGETRGSELLAVVAREAGAASELPLGPDHIAYLLDHKLAPLGLTTYTDGATPKLAVNTPFLALRARLQLFGPAATWVVGGLLGWLFHPVAIVVAVGAAGFAQWWVFAGHSMTSTMQATVADPAGVLAVLGLAVASTAFHECGHAAACRYSGAVPGGMGFGIYLVWPAFYTDITDSYRLGRGGRLRTDLGGVYFNALSVVGLAALYAGTGWAPLLVAVLSVNLEIVQQLLPTLRFDGYYIIADAVGIPDLFRYIRPIIAHHVLRRPADERLTALKRWPQIAVTAWVLVIVPALLAELSYLAWQVPTLVRTAVGAIEDLLRAAPESMNPALDGLSATARMLLLLLPLAGVAAIAWQLGRMGSRWASRLPVARLRLPVPRARRAFAAGLAAAAGLTLGGATWAMTARAPDHAPAVAQPPAHPTPPITARPGESAPAPPAPITSAAPTSTSGGRPVTTARREPVAETVPAERSSRTATRPSSTSARPTTTSPPASFPTSPGSGGPPPLSDTGAPSCPVAGVPLSC